MKTRTYSEVSRLATFDERFDYLKLSGAVGRDTFGFDRHINQRFYRSREWRQIRHHVIARDLGCDLGVEGFEIHDAPYIHHINPMTVDQLVHGDSDVLDPEFLITVTHRTHNLLHYGGDSGLPRVAIERKPGDTKLW